MIKKMIQTVRNVISRQQSLGQGEGLRAGPRSLGFSPVPIASRPSPKTPSIDLGARLGVGVWPPPPPPPGGLLLPHITSTEPVPSGALWGSPAAPINSWGWGPSPGTSGPPPRSKVHSPTPGVHPYSQHHWFTHQYLGFPMLQGSIPLLQRSTL